MINLGELVLSEGREFKDTYYVAVLDTEIVIMTNKVDAELYSEFGVINVYHSGMYFGTQSEMRNWIALNVMNHLIDIGEIIKTGETETGDSIWEWNEPNNVSKMNFNKTLIGYAIKACKIKNITGERRKEIIGGLYSAMDILTMEEAREEYKKEYGS